MIPAPASLVPMAHVRDVARSIAFYRRLGFEVANTVTPPGATAPIWAMIGTDRARLMLNLADGEVDPDQQAILFYLYFEDIDAVHADLAGAGFAVGAMRYPPHRPRGEFSLLDPDGYCLVLTHS